LQQLQEVTSLVREQHKDHERGSFLDKGKRPREKSPDFELENPVYKKQGIQSSGEMDDGAGPSHLNHQETSEANQDSDPEIGSGIDVLPEERREGNLL
jgi:hypothetical protein